MKDVCVTLGAEHVDAAPSICSLYFRNDDTMPVGTIARLVTDRGFGFIKTDHGDMFFHMSSVQDVDFEDLNEGQSVEYTEGQGPKGPRAESVKPV